MIKYILILTAVFFLVGGMGVAIVCRRRPEKRRALLIKYFTYILIVGGVLCSLAYTEQYIWLGFLICTISFGELIYAWIRSEKHILFLLTSGVTFFSACSFLFLWGMKIFPAEFLLKVYTVVFCFDGFSQVSGQLSGKRKLVKTISPEKTLAGFIGGFIIAFTTGLLVFSTGSNYLRAAVLAGVVVTSAFSGDLLASLYKRKCGIKDYGKLLPGHGGFLDRFDSFLVSLATLSLLSLLTLL